MLDCQSPGGTAVLMLSISDVEFGNQSLGGESGVVMGIRTLASCPIRKLGAELSVRHPTVRENRLQHHKSPIGAGF